MGENQGMIWIILGVIVVAGALLVLGTTMKTSITDTASDIEAGEVVAE